MTIDSDTFEWVGSVKQQLASLETKMNSRQQVKFKPSIDYIYRLLDLFQKTGGAVKDVKDKIKDAVDKIQKGLNVKTKPFVVTLPTEPTIDEITPETALKAKMAEAAYKYHEEGPSIEKIDNIEESLGGKWKIDTDLSSKDGLVLHDGEGNAKVAFRGLSRKGSKIQLAKDIAKTSKIMSGYDKYDNPFQDEEGIVERAQAKYSAMGGGVDELIGHQLGGAKAYTIGDNLGIKTTTFNPITGPKLASQGTTSTEHNIFRTTEDWNSISLDFGTNKENVTINSVYPKKTSINPFEAGKISNFTEPGNRARESLLHKKIRKVVDTAKKHAQMENLHDGVNIIENKELPKKTGDLYNIDKNKAVDITTENDYISEISPEAYEIGEQVRQSGMTVKDIRDNYDFLPPEDQENFDRGQKDFPSPPEGPKSNVVNETDAYNTGVSNPTESDIQDAIARGNIEPPPKLFDETISEDPLFQDPRGLPKNIRQKFNPLDHKDTTTRQMSNRLKNIESNIDHTADTDWTSFDLPAPEGEMANTSTLPEDINPGYSNPFFNDNFLQVDAGEATDTLPNTEPVPMEENPFVKKYTKASDIDLSGLEDTDFSKIKDAKKPSKISRIKKMINKISNNNVEHLPTDNEQIDDFINSNDEERTRKVKKTEQEALDAQKELNDHLTVGDTEDVVNSEPLEAEPVVSETAGVSETSIIEPTEGSFGRAALNDLKSALSVKGLAKGAVAGALGNAAVNYIDRDKKIQKQAREALVGGTGAWFATGSLFQPETAGGALGYVAGVESQEAITKATGSEAAGDTLGGAIGGGTTVAATEAIGLGAAVASDALLGTTIGTFFDPISFGTGTLIGAGVGAAFGGLAYGATQVPWKKVGSALTDAVDTVGSGIEDAGKAVAGAFESIF
jgi:hypothetical protein